MTDDAWLYVAKDGTMWSEVQIVRPMGLECSEPAHRVVAIKDGTGLPRPLMCYVAPDRASWIINVG